jgi:hypothetical protein
VSRTHEHSTEQWRWPAPRTGASSEESMKKGWPARMSWGMNERQ